MPENEKLEFHLACAYMDIRSQNGLETDRVLSVPHWFNVRQNTIFEPEYTSLDSFTRIYSLRDVENAIEEFDYHNTQAWRLLMTLSTLGKSKSNNKIVQTYGKSLLVIWPKRFGLENRLRLEFNTAIASVLKAGIEVWDDRFSNDIETILRFIATHRLSRRLHEANLSGLLIALRKLGLIGEIDSLLCGLDLNKQISIELAKCVLQHGDRVMAPIVNRRMHPVARNMIYVIMFISVIYLIQSSKNFE